MRRGKGEKRGEEKGEENRGEKGCIIQCAIDKRLLQTCVVDIMDGRAFKTREGAARGRMMVYR